MRENQIKVFSIKNQVVWHSWFLNIKTKIIKVKIVKIDLYKQYRRRRVLETTLKFRLKKSYIWVLRKGSCEIDPSHSTKEYKIQRWLFTSLILQIPLEEEKFARETWPTYGLFFSSFNPFKLQYNYNNYKIQEKRKVISIDTLIFLYLAIIYCIIPKLIKVYFKIYIVRLIF